MFDRAPQTASPKVLILEDEALISLALHKVFREEGFDPLVVPTVKRALELCERHRFAAAVLDWRLPDGDPEPIVERLKRCSAGVVVLTGEDERRLKVADGVTVLYKPYPMADLVRCVRERMLAMEAG
jgi:DNA-binding response OmpR family regulator